jgi:hypothetical protein
MAEAEICLVDIGTTNTILRETKYFQTLTKKNGNIMSIASESATLVLPMGTQIFVKDALLYPDSKRTLLSFKDICSNDFHIEIEIEQGTEYLIITKFDGYRKKIVERLLLTQNRGNTLECARTRELSSKRSTPAKPWADRSDRFRRPV